MKLNGSGTWVNPANEEPTYTHWKTPPSTSGSSRYATFQGVDGFWTPVYDSKRPFWCEMNIGGRSDVVGRFYSLTIYFILTCQRISFIYIIPSN